MSQRLPAGAHPSIRAAGYARRDGALPGSLEAGCRPVRGIRSVAQPDPGGAGARREAGAGQCAHLGALGARAGRGRAAASRMLLSRLRHGAGAGRRDRGALPHPGRAQCAGGRQPEGRCAAAGRRRRRAGRHAPGRSAAARCCWRPRPIPARTRPCCRRTTCCARNFPICSPSWCRAIPRAAPIWRCCAAPAPAAPLAGRADHRPDRHLYRRHDGRAGTVLSPRAFLLPGRHPGAAWAGTIRWSRQCCIAPCWRDRTRASAPTRL